ncbi:MAG: FMN-binding protein [Candidatus Eisenbacteria bacterium]|nr:FMN-binding protein [Candidatus Eisenbacteria bacterium]
MSNFLKLVGALALIAAAASFGLSAIYSVTHEITEEYRLAEQGRARIEALACDPGAVFVRTETDSILNGRPFSYYRAYASEAREELLGYSFTAYGNGYSSTIVSVVGVDVDGTICGIKITNQQETPGLGSKIQEVASENTLWAVMSGSAVDESGKRPWFQEQFAGTSLEGLRVVKSESEEGILAVTGATISSEAVTESVREGLAMLLSIVGGPGTGSDAGEEAAQ